MLLTSGVIVSGDGAAVSAGLTVLALAVVMLPWAVVTAWGLLRSLVEGDGEGED